MSDVTDESMRDHFQGRSLVKDVTMRQQKSQEANVGFASQSRHWPTSTMRQDRTFRQPKLKVALRQYQTIGLGGPPTMSPDLDECPEVHCLFASKKGLSAPEAAERKLDLDPSPEEWPPRHFCQEKVRSRKASTSLLN